MGLYRSATQEILYVPVRICLPSAETETLLRHAEEAPNPVVGRLLLDTGTKRSSVIPRVVERLGCPIRGRWRVETAVGQALVNYYDVRFEFTSSTLAALPRCPVAALAMPTPLADYDGVIGRDILHRWEFWYSGIRGRLTIRDYASFWGWLSS